MPIIGIEGDISGGKTLTQTYFLIEEHRKLKKRLITNYHLRGIPHTYITLEDLMMLAEDEEDLSDVALGIDEIHIWADARLSSSKKNRLFSYFALQTGKDDMNLYYTTQDFFQLDLRIAKQTRIGIHTRMKGDLALLTLRHMQRPEMKIPDAVIYGPDVYPFYYTKEKIRMTRPAAST